MAVVAPLASLITQGYKLNPHLPRAMLLNHILTVSAQNIVFLR